MFSNVKELRGEVTVQRDSVSLNVDEVHGILRVLVVSLALSRGHGSVKLNRSRLGRVSEDRSNRSTEAHRLEAVSTKSDVELVNSQDSRGNNANVAESSKSNNEVDAEAGVRTEVSRVLSGGNTGASGKSRIPVPAVLQSGKANTNVSKVAILVPAVKHSRLRGIRVDGRAKTNIHGLKGPFHLLKEDRVGVLVDTLSLVAVNANQGEADTLDEDVVTIYTKSS